MLPITRRSFLWAAGAPALAQSQSSRLTRAETEEFLLKAGIVSERPRDQRQSRISLDDGKRKHDANVETEDGSTPSRRDYRLNVAAYELDKLLELRMSPPTVERTVNRRPASVTWWVDDVAISEADRRKKKIEPPDPESWSQQMQAVRLFDELMSNPYRSMEPADAESRQSVWDELLITKAWRIWLIDHTRTFRIGKRLEHPQSLTRCDRALLGKLRELNKEAVKGKLGKYLTPEQLDALEARRELLVGHFDERIRSKGAGAVLYDLPPRQ